MGRVGDADMDNPPHSRLYCGPEQSTGVFGGGVMSDAAAGKADPVGVVQDIGSFEAGDQLWGVAEVQRPHLHVVAEGAAGDQCAGESSDSTALVQQAPGDVLAGVAESPGDYADARLAHHLCGCSAGCGAAVTTDPPGCSLLNLSLSSLVE